eukprot:341790_1
MDFINLFPSFNSSKSARNRSLIVCPFCTSYTNGFDSSIQTLFIKNIRQNVHCPIDKRNASTPKSLSNDGLIYDSYPNAHGALHPFGNRAHNSYIPTHNAHHNTTHIGRTSLSIHHVILLILPLFITELLKDGKRLMKSIDGINYITRCECLGSQWYKFDDENGEVCGSQWKRCMIRGGICRIIPRYGWPCSVFIMDGLFGYELFRM